MNRILFICASVIFYTHLNGAASDELQNTLTSSSGDRSSSKRAESPELLDHSPKRQRASDQSAGQALDKGRFLKLHYKVPGGRGSVSVEVNLDEEDHFAKETFTVLMQDNFAQGIPWIIARHLHKTGDGGLGEDVFDGRQLHAFLTKSKKRPKVHPMHRGKFIGEPLYYSVIQGKEGLQTRFLGTETDIDKDNAQGEKMRAVLELNQRPELWAGIAVCCLRLEEYADMHRWLHAALRELQEIPEDVSAQPSDSDSFVHAMARVEQAITLMESRNFPYLYMLRKCAFAYLEQDMKSEAIGVYHKITEVLAKEQKQCGKTLRRLGFLYYETKNYEEALRFLGTALPVLRAENRNYGHVLKYIGRVFKHRKNWAQTLHFLNEALPVLKKEDGKIIGTLSTRGKVYFQMELWHECIGSYNELLEETDRFTSESYTWIGQAYEKMDKLKAAVLSYRQACEADDAVRGTQFVHMLFLNATQRANCEIIDEDEMKKIAKRFLASSEQEQSFYLKNYPDRYAVALEEANRIAGPDSDSDDDLQTSSSID